MIQLKDKQGNIIAELSEEMFPLSMPVTTKIGEREYFIHVYYEPNGKVRSALLNTKQE